jgi:hypothetical protein
MTLEYDPSRDVFIFSLNITQWIRWYRGKYHWDAYTCHSDDGFTTAMQ